jgi:DivIVA domain-containing protein
MRRKREEQSAGEAVRPTRLTPGDVQQVEFRLAFRGYNERDVDAFLDRVTEDLGAYMEESAALRSGSGAPAADLGATRAQAERILAEARQEAARIVRDAQADVAVSAVPDARAAVAPFLNREREFLQGLGELVQRHAEEIRQMVGALRARDEIRERAEGQPAEGARRPRAEAAEAAASKPKPESTEEASDSKPASDTKPAPASPSTSAGAQAESPIEIPDVSSRSERSLRDLFWGED